MTTTPLPPLPEPEGERFVDLTPAVYAMWERQMRAYAFAARADLEAEVARLREELATVRGEALEPATNKSHRCIKCLYAYSPEGDESEDCPSCGHDGSELKETP